MLIGAPGSSFGPVPPNTTVSRAEVKEELVELLTDKYGDNADLVAELTLWEYARTKEPTMLYNIVNQVQDQQAAVTVRALLVKLAAGDNSSIYRYVLGKQDVSNADLLAPPTDAPPLLPDEKIMSDRLTAIVQDFVLESTPGASLPPPANSWAPVTPDHTPFFELSAMSIPRTTQDINPPRPDFWTQHVPEVIDITDSSDSAEDETRSKGGVSEAYFIATWVLVVLLILLLILLVIAVVVLIKYKRGKYNMDREGTVKYVAK